MTTTTGPVLLGGSNQRFSLTSPILANVSQRWWAVVQNSSDYFLMVGTDHGTHWIPPYVVDKVDGRSNPPTLDVATVTAAGGIDESRGTDSVTVVWGTEGESISQSYPLSLGPGSAPIYGQPTSSFGINALINSGASYVMLPRPGAGHAYRLYYGLITGTATTQLDACAFQGYNGTLNTGASDAAATYTHAFPPASTEILPTQFFRVLIAQTLITSAPWTAQPNGAVLLDNVGIILTSSAATGSDAVDASIIYSLDH